MDSFGGVKPTGIVPSISSAVKADAIAKAEKNSLNNAKAMTKEKNKQLALDKAKASLAKARANFDITKINLAAALKGKVTEEERLRLLALQAIENENGDLALSWIAKLDAARKKAADDEASRQENLIASIQARMNVIMALQDRVNAKIAGNTISAQAATVSDVQSRMDTISALQARVDAKIAGNSVTVNVAGSVISQQELVGAVRDGLLNDSLSAKQANVNRQLGSFVS
jgi:hypothetical protein